MTPDLEPTTALQERARAYLRTRGTLQAASVIHDRVRAACVALEAFLDTVPAETAAARSRPDAWTVQEIVDHLLETHRAGLDELRCLLAGERPPGGPIPAGLQSKAPHRRPWSWLRRELRRLHDDILETLSRVPADFTTDARAPLVMVVSVPRPDGPAMPVHWIEELDWKAYAIVWRVHILEHLAHAKQRLGVA